ncbi:MAG TPA: hypothetical protein VKT80_10320, partial [Chloroflexota bacterium]|nr:hypothetical protein [Chloroflexota bacterium]
PPSTDAFSQAGESGTLAPSSFAPAFFGDLLGVNSVRFVPNPQIGDFPPGGTLVSTPSAARAGGWKIADGESPVPTDRIYYNFNWYSDVRHSLNSQTMAEPTAASAFNVFRHILGLEKTLFNERMSVGLRLPFVDVEGPPKLTVGTQFFQTQISPLLSDREFADMSIIWKLAVVKEPTRVVSTGMVITVPTGQGFVLDLPNVRGQIDGLNQTRLQDVLLQPYVGFWRRFTERAYFHSFNSIAIPTDSRDVVFMFNDIGFGYWLYRNPNDRFVQGVVPTIELHLDTPLTDRGAQTIPIGVSDQLNLTLGGYAVLPRSLLGWAVAVPLLGPRSYGVEMLANYTLRF